MSNSNNNLTARLLHSWFQLVHTYIQTYVGASWSSTLRPDLILTSPYRRTVQTAELVAGALGQPMQSVPFLASGMTPETALDELRAYQRFDSVMLVGHQPDLGILTATLLGLRNDDALPVGKASLICLEVERCAPSNASLRFLLPVKMMK